MAKRAAKKNSINEQDIDIGRLLDENLTRVNRLGELVFAGTLTIVLVSTLLNEIGVYKMSYYSGAQLTVVGSTICALGIICNRISRITPQTRKTINLVCFIMLSAWMCYLFGYNAPYMFPIVIIMGALYFDIRTTIINYISAVIVMAVTTYIAATHNGILDNNHVDVADGTVLVCENGLKRTLLAAGLRDSMYVRKVMINDLLPKLITSLLLLVLAIALTKIGYEMIARQAKVAGETAKVATELQLASQLQQNALPLFDTINGKYNFELSGGMRAAKDVGGDFYDFGMLDENHLVMIIADVSDKGIPASLMMMSAKGKIRGNLRPERTPAEVLGIVNKLLCENNQEDMFVTAWLGILDISTGRMTAVNAGHENPIFIRNGCRPEEYESEHGIVLGLFPDVEYRNEEYKLNPGDVLLLYTDGVTEARDVNGELYGIERVLNGLEEELSEKNISAKDVTDTLKRQIEIFADEADQSDDITMLAIKLL